MNDDFKVDEETTGAFAAYLLSKFLQNNNQEAMDAMIDFTNRAPRESLIEFFHSINVFVSLPDANLASAIEKCQQFYNVDPALFSDFMPESNRSQILTRLRAQRLSKFSASNRHQTPHMTEERKTDDQ